MQLVCLILDEHPLVDSHRPTVDDESAVGNPGNGRANAVATVCSGRSSRIRRRVIESGGRRYRDGVMSVRRASGAGRSRSARRTRNRRGSSGSTGRTGRTRRSGRSRGPVGASHTRRAGGAGCPIEADVTCWAGGAGSSGRTSGSGCASGACCSGWTCGANCSGWNVLGSIVNERLPSRGVAAWPDFFAVHNDAIA